MENYAQNTLLEVLKNDTFPLVDLYWYYHGLDERILIINDEISSAIVEEIILPLKAMETSDNTKPITLYINTPGGSVYDGMVLCNVIDNIKCPLNIVVLGEAFSMGLLIAMAGANNPNVTRKAYPFSFGLMHEGYAATEGSMQAMRQVQAFHNKISRLSKQYILSHTKMTEQFYDDHQYDEYYMTAEEMLELGIIDEIIWD